MWRKIQYWLETSIYDWKTGVAPARYREFMEMVEEAGIVQIVNFATQIRGICLDLMITNMPERVMDVEGWRHATPIVCGLKYESGE
jgi:hypothetical protein